MRGREGNIEKVIADHGLIINNNINLAIKFIFQHP